MEKKKNNSLNLKLIQARTEGKLKLLRTYPEAMLYKFHSISIRNRYIRNIRLIETAYNTVLEFWGMGISTEQKNKAEEEVNKITQIARNIIALKETFEYLEKDEKFFEDLKKMKQIEKENIIKNAQITFENIDLLIPRDRNTNFWYKSLVYIDKYDLEIKKSSKAEEWIQLLIDFNNQMNETRDILLDLLKDVPLKYGTQYKSLIKEIQNFRKEKN